MLTKHASIFTLFLLTFLVLLASVSAQDDALGLWDAKTSRHIKTLTGHTDEVRSVSFSPDGDTIASGSGTSDKTVRLWDTKTGKPLKTLTGHTDAVYSVSFSPDGHKIASGSWDKTIRLWTTISGRPLKTLTGHTGSVNSVSFSPDGHKIASGSWDNTVRLWEVSAFVTRRRTRSEPQTPNPRRTVAEPKTAAIIHPSSIHPPISIHSCLITYHHYFLRSYHSLEKI